MDISNIVEILKISAITAPKARGENNILFKNLSFEEKNLLVQNMKILAEKENYPTFLRDANCIEKADAVVLIGTKLKRIGLKICGNCGAKNCADAEEKNLVCAFNSGDLGIAIGSFVSKAMDFRIDNRIMHTAGIVAKQLNLLEEAKIVFAIPLSISGKNIFFDR
jgi:uncharacterized ferredoxin-like protein